MTLRTALVIEGSAEGAKKASQDTVAGIEQVKKAASEATNATAGVADTLARAASGAGSVTNELKQLPPAVQNAAGAFDDLGGKAEVVRGKYSDAHTAVLGFVTGLASGAAMGAIAGAVEGAVVALGQYAVQALTKTDEIDAALKAHVALIKSIKGAYAEAEGGASSYGNNAVTRLRFESQQNIGRLQGAYADALPNGDQMNLGLFATEAGGPLASPVQKFLEDIRKGKADVIAFRNEISSIAAELPSDDTYRGIAETILKDTSTAAEVLEELRRSQDVLKGIEGDTTAAATALGGAADKYDSLGRLAGAAAGAVPPATEAIAASGHAADTAAAALERYRSALDAVGSGVAPSPARSAATMPEPQKFAAGGIVDRPTLFGFDGGRTGLMGEAGPEAILPLIGGMVRATTANGGEIGLSLTRLGDGALGVSLPQAFALGGSFADTRPGAAGDKALFSGLTADISLLRGAFSGFVADLQRGQTAMQALGSVVGRVADRYLNMALGEADKALFGSGGWLGGLFGGSQWNRAASGMITGLFHSGGLPGRSPSAQRSVSPSVFIDAPRLHQGGLVAGEVPIIAQEGEEVGWPAALARKYGGQGSVTNIYVETENARSFAQNRASVARSAARLSARAQRYV